MHYTSHTNNTNASFADLKYSSQYASLNLGIQLI